MCVCVCVCVYVPHMGIDYNTLKRRCLFSRQINPTNQISLTEIRHYLSIYLSSFQRLAHVNMIVSFIVFQTVCISVKPNSLLSSCDQSIMTGSSLDMGMFIQPFLPAEAAGKRFFFFSLPQMPRMASADLSQSFRFVRAT